MITLEHINLVVKNIDNSLKFYQAAFPHWSVRGGDKGEWHGKPRNWVHFGDDYQYIALNDNGEHNNRDLRGHQVGVAHFAFVTTDIKGMVERLAQAGFTVDKDGAEDDYRDNVYYLDPDGFEVEFVQYHNDLPQLRNRY
jgi:catechol 2,3-dioxygenase-like lactoylglutathione lyase family enzyme